MKYFLHDSKAFDDEKVTMIFIEYGYEGVGLFYCILEKLALQEKPIQEIVLRKQLFIGKKLEKQLYFMYKIGILSVKNGEVFSNNLLNFSEKYQIKKEKTRKRVSEWREKQEDTESVTRYKRVRNTPKVKESKVKENKIDIIPTFEEFKNYCLTQKANIDTDHLKLKFNSWIENGWKDGNNVAIKNWKSKANNIIPYIKEIQSGTKQMVY